MKRSSEEYEWSGLAHGIHERGVQWRIDALGGRMREVRAIGLNLKMKEWKERVHHIPAVPRVHTKSLAVLSIHR